MRPTHPSQQRPPLVIAHRGLHQRYPENSLAAFEAAWESGIDWCECDVRATACGTPIVFHDEELDRMTGKGGRVDQCSWQQIAEACLRSDGGIITECTICLLESACARVGTATPSGGRRRLLVEIKAPCAVATIQRIVSAFCLKIDGEIAMQSFDSQMLAQVHRLLPHISTYLLLESTEHLDSDLEAPWSGINVQYDLLTPRLVERVRGRGKSIGVWTPNAESDLRRAIELGVDTIITDEPLLARTLVEDRMRANASNP